MKLHHCGARGSRNERHWHLGRVAIRVPDLNGPGIRFAGGEGGNRGWIGGSGGIEFPRDGRKGAGNAEGIVNDLQELDGEGFGDTVAGHGVV